MKKISLIILSILMIAVFAACDANNENIPNAEGKPTNNPGITVNTIAFNRVRLEDLSEELQNAVNQTKEEPGYDILTSGEDSYLVVYAGQKPTGGYSIEITDIVDNEGITRVTVTEAEPPADAMVTQALTYPMDIVFLHSGISGNVQLNFERSHE